MKQLFQFILEITEGKSFVFYLSSPDINISDNHIRNNQNLSCIYYKQMLKLVNYINTTTTRKMSLNLCVFVFVNASFCTFNILVH